MGYIHTYIQAYSNRNQTVMKRVQWERILPKTSSGFFDGIWVGKLVVLDQCSKAWDLWNLEKSKYNRNKAVRGYAYIF